MGRKKGQGAGRNGRDSQGQRRGVKVFSTQIVTAGSILVRQVGTRIHPGLNVGKGKDCTLYAKINGQVIYEKFGKDKKRVKVVPQAQ
jgi:large subunit ribosomal protein L27